jgi:ABC-type uncharacterized transport system auxiliary subunit
MFLNKGSLMRKNTLSIAIVWAIILLLSGCGRTRYPSYYTLSIAPALTPNVSSTHPPMTVAVQRFETPAYLRQGRIVYSKAPGDIGFYEYHRWAVDPGAAVTTAVVESLRSERLFSSAAPYNGQQSVDYLLSGRLEKLEEVDYGGGVNVEAKLSAELMNLRTGSIVWTGDAAESSRVEGHDVNSVVTEMSRALQSSIDRLLSGMEHQISGT